MPEATCVCYYYSRESHSRQIFYDIALKWLRYLTKKIWNNGLVNILRLEAINLQSRMPEGIWNFFNTSIYSVQNDSFYCTLDYA